MAAVKDEKTFEEKIKLLEEIVKELESGEVPLDDAINKYTEAMKLAKDCSLKLNKVEEKVNKIMLDNGKLEDFLNKNETIGYNFLRNQVQEMIIPVKCDDKYYASISVLKNKTKSNVDYKDNKYEITFNIKTKAVIAEYNCSKDLTDEKTIEELEKLANKKIKKYINSALDKQKEAKGKFLGLERLIYLDYPDYKNEEYNVKLKVDLELNRKGETRNSSKGAKTK